MMFPQQRLALMDLIRDLSFKQGEQFTLVSGKTSNIYFNLKPVILSAQGANLIAAAVLLRMHQLRISTVAGLEVGAIPIISSTIALSIPAKYPVNGLFIRKEKKDHGTGNKIEGLAENESLVDRKVVIVEDVTTTGSSAYTAANALKLSGAKVRHVITVVDREEGAESFFAEKGITLHSMFKKSEFTDEPTV